LVWDVEIWRLVEVAVQLILFNESMRQAGYDVACLSSKNWRYAEMA